MSHVTIWWRCSMRNRQEPKREGSGETQQGHGNHLPSQCQQRHWQGAGMSRHVNTSSYIFYWANIVRSVCSPGGSLQLCFWKWTHPSRHCFSEVGGHRVAGVFPANSQPSAGGRSEFADPEPWRTQKGASFDLWFDIMHGQWARHEFFLWTEEWVSSESQQRRGTAGDVCVLQLRSWFLHQSSWDKEPRNNSM